MRPQRHNASRISPKAKVPRVYPNHELRIREKYSGRGHEFSIGEWAGRLKMRPATLITLFQRAGVSGLTPSHVLKPSHAEALRIYITAGKQPSATELYADDLMLDQKLVTVQSISRHLMELLAKSPGLIHQLDPRRFEEVVAELLSAQGCSVKLTKRTRDGGYDIMGSIDSGPSEFVFLAECKRYAPDNKVGVELVRSLYGVTEANKANQGLLITSSSFTRDAVEEKLRIGPRIALKDFETLKTWLDQYKSK